MITITFNNDSTKIDNIKVKGETDYTLYSCRAVIVTELKGTPIVDKTVEPDTTDGFDVWFTPQEAEQLSANVIYFIVYEVTKTEAEVITYRREHHKKIRVDPDGV